MRVWGLGFLGFWAFRVKGFLRVSGVLGFRIYVC